MRYSEFKPLLDWWNDRKENKQAWLVSIDEVIHRKYDLDFPNPSKTRIEKLRLPREIVQDIIDNQEKMLEISRRIQEKIDSW